MTDALYPRFARQTVDAALAAAPVVVIQGARQVGKSTPHLAQQGPVGFVDQAPTGVDDGRKVRQY